MERRQPVRLGLIYCASDLLGIVCAYYTTLFIRFNDAWGGILFTWINRTLGIRETGEVGEAFEQFYVSSAPRIIALLMITLVVLYALRDLYAERRFLKKQQTGWNLLVCNLLALALFYAYFYLRRNDFHPRSMFAMILACNVCYGTILRALTEAILRRLRVRFNWDRSPVILIGKNRHATRIAEMLEHVPSRSLYLAEQLDTSPSVPFPELLDRVRMASKHHAAGMLIMAEADLSVAELMQFLQLADDLDIPVKVLSKELDVLLTRAGVQGDLVHGIPLVHFGSPSQARRFDEAKQIGSAMLAATALLIISPFMLVIALLIKLTSRGPVFFVQERIGINHKPFHMFKFRTMIADAASAQRKLESLNEAGHGALFKIRKDPRITPVGSWLRRYSIDELPQLLNVIRGDMTLVGPRPLPRRDFENYYEDWHYGRHSGRPGLTCLWQVSGRNDLDFHTMCLLDVYYLRNQDWILDLRIALRTIRVVLFAHGAY